MPGHVAVVEAERELADVAVQMLRAGVVIDTMDAALHDRPHAFDPVGVNTVADVFARAVVDALVGVEQPVEPEVSAVLVRVERRAGLNVAVDRPVKGVGRRVGDHASLGASASLSHPQHGSLADRAAPGIELLALVLVGFLTANIHLVDFDDAAQHAGVIAARLAEPLKHEPRGLLRDPDLLRQLHRRDALAGRDQQIHGVEPLMERDVGPLENGRGADGEVRLTGVTAVEAALTRGDPLGLVTGRADGTFRPPLALHVDPRGFSVGEHLEKLERGDGGLAHRSYSEVTPVMKNSCSR